MVGTTNFTPAPGLSRVEFCAVEYSMCPTLVASKAYRTAGFAPGLADKRSWRAMAHKIPLVLPFAEIDGVLPIVNRMALCATAVDGLKIPPTMVNSRRLSPAGAEFSLLSPE